VKDLARRLLDYVEWWRENPHNSDTINAMVHMVPGLDEPIEEEREITATMLVEAATTIQALQAENIRLVRHLRSLDQAENVGTPDHTETNAQGDQQ
jgi:hypothetical protein